MSMKRLLISLVLILAFVLPGCGFGPPPSCGDTIGGTADTAKFDQYFTSMQLVAEDTGQPGQDGESGAQFPSGTALAILVESKSQVDVRACIQPRSTGELAFDGTQTMPVGQGTFSVGAFEPGGYVIRVIVDGVLVKNFPFEIK